MTKKNIIEAWLAKLNTWKGDYNDFPFYHFATDYGEACCFSCGKFFGDCQAFGGGKHEHVIKAWDAAPLEIYQFDKNNDENNPLSYALLCHQCTSAVGKIKLNGSEQFFGWSMGKRGAAIQ